jgi:hypothetical protein
MNSELNQEREKREQAPACTLQRIVRWFLDARTERLWHPDSPGMRVTVIRTRFGRWSKSSDFATLGEAIKSYSANPSVDARQAQQPTKEAR